MLNVYRGFIWENEKVLELGNGDVCTMLRMYLMAQNYTLKSD